MTEPGGKTNVKVLSVSVLWAAQGDGHKLGLNREENKKMTANDGGGHRYTEHI